MRLRVGLELIIAGGGGTFRLPSDARHVCVLGDEGDIGGGMRVFQLVQNLSW